MEGSYIDKHYRNIARTYKQWNDPNVGANTEELRLLERSLELALSDVKNILSLRESDKEE
jgi:hypothetical protein